MEQHGQRRSAAVKDAQIKLSDEECVGVMEPRSTTRNAAVKDALTLLRREECV